MYVFFWENDLIYTHTAIRQNAIAINCTVPRLFRLKIPHACWKAPPVPCSERTTLGQSTDILGQPLQSATIQDRFMDHTCSSACRVLAISPGYIRDGSGKYIDPTSIAMHALIEYQAWLHWNIHSRAQAGHHWEIWHEPRTTRVVLCTSTRIMPFTTTHSSFTTTYNTSLTTMTPVQFGAIVNQIYKTATVDIGKMEIFTKSKSNFTLQSVCYDGYTWRSPLTNSVLVVVPGGRAHFCTVT